ncbi:hypothetical protein LH464_23415 [Neorhizobium sp. T786]|uniref:hypothetical protein n=1 Tax=Pseudorhizobium xiangyangii TaxID=2883104 RepID=UPI001CFFBD0F|nr:hypothetical protein [Neorhizobium xiangyangii]MCB5205413.1 hypothetical protein [Neorhizobium xiangyangii]
MNMLLEYWGGEAAYWAFLGTSEDFVLATLRRIGRPRIIEFQVPISCTFYGEAGAGTATSIIDAYATLHGIQRYPRDLDITLTAPLPSSAVLEIHTEGNRTSDVLVSVALPALSV